MIREKCVLGTLMENNYLFADTNLKADQFSEAVNKNIFSRMMALAEQNKSFDMTSLLMYSDNYDEIGGGGYLAELVRFSNPVKFDEYCEAVKDHWKVGEKRRILQAAVNEDWDQEKVIEYLTKLESAKSGGPKDINIFLAENHDKPFVKRQVDKGVTTGIKLLDKVTSGLQGSNLIVIAARPSMGKTDVMLKLARSAGWDGYLPVIFSLEMSEEQLHNRNIATVGNYSRDRMADPEKDLTDEQKDRWGDTLGKLSMTKMHVDETGAQTIPEMRAGIRKTMNNNPDRPPVVFIDYLTLIKSTETGGSTHERIGDIAKGLKNLSKEFNCPIVVLAQLNRGVEQRQDKRPMLSDLRESGTIEEATDLGIMLYRDSYYDAENDDSTLEMIVTKNRNGATGTVMVAYNRVTGGIYDLEAIRNDQ